jgi:hypothetical protein
MPILWSVKSGFTRVWKVLEFTDSSLKRAWKRFRIKPM